MAETLEIWNVAKRMKEMAEVLQGAAWIGVGIGIFLSMGLLRQWKRERTRVC